MKELFPIQIKALSGNTENKIRILDYLANKHEGATSKEIKSSVLKKSKNATFYNYLNRLKTSDIISKKYINGEYRYFLTGEDLSILFKSELPTVRTSVGHRGAIWDSNNIANSLLEILVEPNKDLKPGEIVKELEQIVKYSNLNSISKPTIRYLISDVLFNNGFKKECHAFLPVGFPLEDIKNFSERENPVGLHKNYVGERFRKQYFLRQIPFNIFSYFVNHPDVHHHGVENMLYPLNIMHDIRWIFLGGLDVRNHRSSPAKHLRSALSQILGLLGFSNHDYVRTQGIHHFNYYIAPYVEGLKQKEIQNECDGFIKQLYREFISRPRDYICSSLTLDLDNTIVKNHEVIKGGTRLGFNYKEYDKLAEKVAVEALREYARGYDDKNPYLYPKIFLALSKDNVDRVLDNKDLVDILYKAIVKSGSKAIYFVNRNEDIGYLSDITRLTFTPQDELRGKGCILATSIINFNSDKNEYDINSIIQQIDEIIDKMRDFGNWKKRKLLDNIYPNNFTILGSIRLSPRQKSYYVIEKPIVSIRFFSLKRIFEQLNKNKNSDEIYKDVKTLFKHIHNRIEEINKVAGIQLTIGQTSSASGAVIRASNRYGIDYDKYALFSSIKATELEEKIKYDKELSQFMNGGMVTRILINRDKYSKEQMKDDLKLCFENDIELINFRDQQFEK